MKPSPGTSWALVMIPVAIMACGTDSDSGPLTSAKVAEEQSGMLLEVGTSLD